MTRPKVIDFKNLPSNPFRGIGAGMLLYLMLEHFAAPGWLCGVAWTVFAIAWMGSWVSFFRQKETDIFTPGKD